MATDNGSAEGSTWPMPKFRFEVDLGASMQKIAFQEVSGMDVEHQIIEYRNSNSPLFSTEKMPGIVKYGNVTMKRGVFVNDNTFWNWRTQISMNTVARQTVVIKLLDENGSITMQWQLLNAWPTKITSTDLKSDGNEVAVDTIEIAHEQLIITNGKSS
ncbi:phage tail protein [Mucilaginibacter terrigena]|uniref:Phage tail protein n=1 Tax=Mucilaginibacter terrigena TaxID=2492395 RepID=A0A4Q5LQE1_9SPHI|nr:phage tail protein [Mucilaginibacter terrigena]RYU91644.1 phage tail protein [Mucilaginibacter terrigena]